MMLDGRKNDDVTADTGVVVANTKNVYFTLKQLEEGGGQSPVMFEQTITRPNSGAVSSSKQRHSRFKKSNESSYYRSNRPWSCKCLWISFVSKRWNDRDSHSRNKRCSKNHWVCNRFHILKSICIRNVHGGDYRHRVNEATRASLGSLLLFAGFLPFYDILPSLWIGNIFHHVVIAKSTFGACAPFSYKVIRTLLLVMLVCWPFNLLLRKIILFSPTIFSFALPLCTAMLTIFIMLCPWFTLKNLMLLYMFLVIQSGCREPMGSPIYPLQLASTCALGCIVSTFVSIVPLPKPSSAILKLQLELQKSQQDSEIMLNGIKQYLSSNYNLQHIRKAISSIELAIERMESTLKRLKSLQEPTQLELDLLHTLFSDECKLFSQTKDGTLSLQNYTSLKDWIDVMTKQIEYSKMIRFAVMQRLLGEQATNYQFDLKEAKITLSMRLHDCMNVLVDVTIQAMALCICSLDVNNTKFLRQNCAVNCYRFCCCACRSTVSTRKKDIESVDGEVAAGAGATTTNTAFVTPIHSATHMATRGGASSSSSSSSSSPETLESIRQSTLEALIKTRTSLEEALDEAEELVIIDEDEEDEGEEEQVGGYTDYNNITMDHMNAKRNSDLHGRQRRRSSRYSHHLHTPSFAFIIRRIQLCHGLFAYSEEISKFLEQQQHTQQPTSSTGNDKRNSSRFSSVIASCVLVADHCISIFNDVINFFRQPWPKYTPQSYRLPFKAALGMAIASLFVAVPALYELAKPNAVWPALTVASVNLASTGSSFTKAIDRLRGTLIASAYALMLSVLLGQGNDGHFYNHWLKIPTVTIFTFIVIYLKDPAHSYEYTYAATSIGSMLYGSIAFNQNLNQYIPKRIALIFVGILIFAFVEIFIFRRSSKQLVQQSALKFFDDMKGFLDTAAVSMNALALYVPLTTTTNANQNNNNHDNNVTVTATPSTAFVDVMKENDTNEDEPSFHSLSPRHTKPQQSSLIQKSHGNDLEKSSDDQDIDHDRSTRKEKICPIRTPFPRPSGNILSDDTEEPTLRTTMFERTNNNNTITSSSSSSSEMMNARSTPIAGVINNNNVVHDNDHNDDDDFRVSDRSIFISSPNITSSVRWTEDDLRNMDGEGQEKKKTSGDDHKGVSVSSNVSNAIATPVVSETTKQDGMNDQNNIVQVSNQSQSASSHNDNDGEDDVYPDDGPGGHHHNNSNHVAFVVTSLGNDFLAEEVVRDARATENNSRCLPAHLQRRGSSMDDEMMGRNVEQLEEHCKENVSLIQSHLKTIQQTVSSFNKELPSALAEPYWGFELKMNPTKFTLLAKLQTICCEQATLLSKMIQGLQTLYIKDLINANPLLRQLDWATMFAHMIRQASHHLQKCQMLLESAFEDARLRPQNDNSDLALRAGIMFRNFEDVRLNLLLEWSKRYTSFFKLRRRYSQANLLQYNNNIENGGTAKDGTIAKIDSLEIRVYVAISESLILEICRHLQKAGKVVEDIVHDYPRMEDSTAVLAQMTDRCTGNTPCAAAAAGGESSSSSTFFFLSQPSARFKTK